MGVITCQYLEMKNYHWRGLYKTPTFGSVPLSLSLSLSLSHFLPPLSLSLSLPASLSLSLSLPASLSLSLPACSGKLRRAVTQFTPYSWTSYRWGYTQSLSRFIFVVIIVIFVSIGCCMCCHGNGVSLAVAGAGAEHVLPQDHSVAASQPHLQLLPCPGLCLQWSLCHEGDVRLSLHEVRGCGLHQPVFTCLSLSLSRPATRMLELGGFPGSALQPSSAR